MDTNYLTHSGMLSSGLLVARLVLGLMMMAHASQKLFGWFGGYGLRPTAGFFEQLGFRPGLWFATAASLGELTSGLLVALGLLGPVGPALMISVMLVAALSVHRPNGIFASTNGIEVPLLYATGAFGLALIGSGPFSLDAVLGISSWWTPAITAAVLLLGVVGGLGNLAFRRHPPVTVPEPKQA